MSSLRLLSPFALLVLVVSACNCDGAGPEPSPVSASLSTIEAESPVSIRGNSSSLVTVTVLDADGNPVPGVEVEIFGSRAGHDVITQPVSPTDEEGVAHGQISSTVEGITVVTVMADQVELDAEATVEFIDEQSCPEGEIFCGEDTGCVTLGTLSHCGSCDDVCSAPDNAEASCTGSCSWACIEGFASCDDDVDGCETELGNLTDCLSCGDACPDFPNSTTVCLETGCDLVCDPGWGSCDGQTSTGCDTELLNGQCPPKDCPSGLVDCGVAGCVELGSEDHCQACHDLCPTPDNSVSVCGLHGCTFACLVGYGNCDGDPATGCEEPLDGSGLCPSGCLPGQADCGGGCVSLSTIEHCGSCDVSCTSPDNASAACLPTGCSFVCDAGFGHCDDDPATGCEQPLDDDLHCGACHAACQDPANAVGFCEDGPSGACGYQCLEGFMDCDGNPANGCETDLSVATCCDFESFISLTSTCLTAEAGGTTVVHVEIRDINGQRVSGANVSVDAGVLTLLDAVVESTAQPGVYFTRLAAPNVVGEFSVTATATYAGDWVCGAQVTVAPTTLSVSPPADYAQGGTGGCNPRGGNLRVRVIDELGDPLVGAFVMVGSSASSQAFHHDYESYLDGGLPSLVNHTLTGNDGYALFLDVGGALGDPSLMITAGAEGRAYSSTVGFDTADVVLVLESLPPPPDRVTLTGGVSPSYVNNNTGRVGMALVTQSMTLGTLARFDFMELLEPDKVVDVSGAVCIAPAGTEVVLPGNIHFPEQSHLGCTLRADPADWWLTPFRGPAVDLPALQGDIGILDALNAGENVATLISAMVFRQVGMTYQVSTDADTPNVAINLSAGLEATMPVQANNAPSGELWLLSVGDIDGENGTGRLYLQGVKVADPASSLSATLTTSKPEGAFTGASHFAMALTMVAGQGASAVLDRVTAGRTGARVLDSFFNTPGSASASGRFFQWQSVANANSPADYHVGRSVLRRVTPPAVGAYRSEEEPFWFVYTPAGIRSFSLPTLPAHAPRFSTQGYLTPSWPQTNRWFLGLYHMGLDPEPDTLIEGKIDFSAIERDLTHLSITQRSM